MKKCFPYFDENLTWEGEGTWKRRKKRKRRRKRQKNYILIFL